MPWQEMSLMDQRLQFLADYQRGFCSMTELCARAAISRKTGYKWIGRYEDSGAAGLVERSHAPHVCPHRIDAAIAELLIRARRSHPSWGPGKLLQYLAPRHPRVAAWPAISTWPISLSGTDSFIGVGAAVRLFIQAPSQFTRRLRTICGRRTSKASSAHATAFTAIPSRLLISTRGT